MKNQSHTEESCQIHDFQPITYLTTEHSDTLSYVYERQCMRCGQKEPVLYKSKEILPLRYSYPLEKILQELNKEK